MNNIALDFGFIQVYWYSIMILIGLLLGMLAIYKEARKRKINIDFMMNLAFYSIIIGIVGARLYYVLFNMDLYGQNILEIFEIWNGGLAIHGGLICGGLFALFYCKKYKANTYEILDICVVGLILAQAIGRWGNFFNGEAYGAITSQSSLSWLPEFISNGMVVDGWYRVPTFLYESIWNIVGFIILIIIRKGYKKLKIGQLTAIYFVWYGAGRFVIEAMRADSLMLGGLKMAQIVSLAMVALGIWLFMKRNKGPRLENLYNAPKTHMFMNREEEKNEIRF